MRNLIKQGLFLLSLFSLGLSLWSSVALGAPVTAFEATGASGKVYKSSDLVGKNVVLEWFNAGCPFVKRAYESGDMPRLQAEYEKKGFIWLTVNSTEESHKDFLDSAKQKEVFEKWQSKPTDYIMDKNGELGHLLGAKTTPHVFLINAKGELAYQGAYDNYPEAEDSPEKIISYFENALKEVANGKPVALSETKPYGCSIKYKE